MTWRCIWDIPGTPFLACVDHDTEAAANLFAIRKSREIRGEVAVVRVNEGLEPLSDAQNPPLSEFEQPNGPRDVHGSARRSDVRLKEGA